MTRKDFNLLAWELANVRPKEVDSLAHFTWTQSVSAVADACAASNSLFKRARFIEAANTWDATIRNGERVFK